MVLFMSDYFSFLLPAQSYIYKYISHCRKSCSVESMEPYNSAVFIFLSEDQNQKIEKIAQQFESKNCSPVMYIKINYL